MIKKKLSQDTKYHSETDVYASQSQQYENTILYNVAVE